MKSNESRSFLLGVNQRINYFENSFNTFKINHQKICSLLKYWLESGFYLEDRDFIIFVEEFREEFVSCYNESESLLTAIKFFKNDRDASTYYPVEHKILEITLQNLYSRFDQLILRQNTIWRETQPLLLQTVYHLQSLVKECNDEIEKISNDTLREQQCNESTFKNQQLEHMADSFGERIEINICGEKIIQNDFLPEETTASFNKLTGPTTIVAREVLSNTFNISTQENLPYTTFFFLARIIITILSFKTEFEFSDETKASHFHTLTTERNWKTRKRRLTFFY